MILFPHCKINLGLSVLSGRPDGFHDIETIFYPVPFCDIIEILPSPSKTTSFKQTGWKLDGKPDENLCMKAYRMMEEKFRIGRVEMMLHKMIPPGSGLGGGSSDAATVLVALDNIFGLGLAGHDLEDMAVMLGSDCPFFLKRDPCLAEGRGELLHKLDLRLDLDIVLVIPPVHVSTAWAYSSIKPRGKHTGLAEVALGPVEGWKELLVNDFEGPVFKEFPELKVIKEKLYALGAVYASMSGSGSCIYGLFDGRSENNFKAHFPGCTVWKGVPGQAKGLI